MGNNELNEWGKLVWINKKNPYLFAERAYDWVDRITFIDESCYDENGFLYRTHKGSITWAKFNPSEWIPLTKEQYDKSKKGYRDIYE